MRFLRRPHIDTDRIDESWQPRLYTRFVVLTLLVAYAIGFVLENGKHVNVHFVFATASVSLVWLILLSNAIGLVGGILLAQLDRRRRRLRRSTTE
jgi:uncharacterized integral membrane protein